LRFAASTADADAAFARDYLKHAKCRALPGELREKKAFADLQNLGQAVTEGPASLSREAHQLIQAMLGSVLLLERKHEVGRPYPPDYVSAETLAYRLDCSRSTMVYVRDGAVARDG